MDLLIKIVCIFLVTKNTLIFISFPTVLIIGENMAELKTKENDASVVDFLNSIEDRQKREDCFVIMDMMKKISGSEPKMWGEKIVGFGKYHYKSQSGREGDWFVIGFAPGKQNISLYILNFYKKEEPKLENLGKHKRGAGCLYIKRLSDVNTDVLQDLMKDALTKNQ